MKKFTPFLMAASLILAACGTQQQYTDKDAAAAIAAAEAAMTQTKKAEFEWRDTSDILDKAKSLAKEGEFDAAVKQANKAKKQADLAMAQAEAAKTAGPRF